MRSLLIKAGVVVAVSLFVFMLGMVGLMYLEGVLLASQELPDGTVCTLVGEPLE